MELGFWDFVAQIIPILIAGALAAVIGTVMAIWFSDNRAYNEGHNDGYNQGWDDCDQHRTAKLSLDRLQRIYNTEPEYTDTPSDRVYPAADGIYTFDLPAPDEPGVTYNNL